MSENIHLGSQYVFIEASGIEEDPPSSEFQTVFTDNVLQIAESSLDQTVTAIVSNHDGSGYSFDLFDSSSGGTAIASEGGIVPSGATSISGVFTSAELQSLTNTDCRIDLVIGDNTASILFTNEIITTPNTPGIHGFATAITASVMPFLINVVWEQKPGDVLTLTAEDQAAPGSPFNVPFQNTVDGDQWHFVAADTQFDFGKIYTLVATATGANAEVSTDTIPLTIEAAPSADIAIFDSSNLVSTGPVQTQNWTLGNNTHSVFLLGYTDLNDPGGSDFLSESIEQPATSHQGTNYPTSGTYYIEFTDIPDNGVGGKDWANITKTVHTFTAAQSANITNLTENGFIASPFDVDWQAGSLTPTSWVLKVGTSLGGEDLHRFVVPAGQLTQTITAHGGIETVHVQLCDITASVETVRDQFIVKGTQPAVSGYHNNIGTVTDSSSFTAPSGLTSGRYRVSNQDNIVIENFKIDNITANPDHYEGGIRLENCNNITIRNGYIKWPESALHSRYPDGHPRGDRKPIIYGGIVLYKCTKITIENVNIANSHTTLRIDNCKDITINNVLSYNCWQHHMQLYKPEVANGHRFTISNIYGYRDHPSYTFGGSMDGMNTAEATKSGSLRASISNVFIEVGNGLNGSGFINEGPGSTKEIGNIDYSDIITLNTNNKGFSNAGGNGSTFTRIWSFQNDRPETYIIQNPKNTGIGPWSAYEHDFAKPHHPVSPNLKDINFGECTYTDCLTHWRKDNKIRGFSEVYISNDQGFRGNGEYWYYTPPGNEPTFVNCQFDSDADEWPPASGNAMSTQGSKNYTTPALTEAQCRAKAETMLAGLPVYTGFGTGSMLEYNRANGI